MIVGPLNGTKGCVFYCGKIPGYGFSTVEKQMPDALASVAWKQHTFTEVEHFGEFKTG